MAQHGHSAACCTVPPVVAKDYSAKGEYVTINGIKTYRTGPKSAKTGILYIMDIFGFKPQTLQGADILAAGDKETPYQVFVPDWFDDKPADIAWYPPDNEEKEKKLGAFFQGPAAPPKTVGKVPDLVKSAAEEFGVEKWGIVGFCWGGKIVNLSSQSGTLFKAAAACHPAMVDPKDAPDVTIPYALLPSKDEDKEAVEGWAKGIKTKHIVKWYPDYHHGWMAARANLENEDEKKGYVDGYQTVLEWFHDNL